jgi:hypothetical protein
MLQAALLLTCTASLAADECQDLCSGATPRCPTGKGLVSSPQFPPVHENVYFRNAARHPVDVFHVDGRGVEVARGVLPPGARRAAPTLHGDVWRARAPNGRLLLEHRISTVQIHACDCPQPQFVDCSRGPTRREEGAVSDPVVFENRADEPVDLFYWNGTCEELVSWDEVGGVQPYARKPLLSTQGHSFRLRSATPSRRMLMAHTLNDVVIRGCTDDEEPREPSAADGLAALRAEATHFESEAARLRERLAAELSKIALAVVSANGTVAHAAHSVYQPATAGLASASVLSHLVSATGASF